MTKHCVFFNKIIDNNTYAMYVIDRMFYKLQSGYTRGQTLGSDMETWDSRNIEEGKRENR